MAKKGKRKGTPPSDQPNIEPSSPPEDPGYPVLGFRLLEKGWGIDRLSHEQAHSFLRKWADRSTMTWKEVMLAPKHALGSESLPASSIIPQIPSWMDKNTKLIVLRHHGRLAQVGIRHKNVFEVIWIEPEYNTLYSHDGKNRR